MKSVHVLLLDSTYEPLKVISWMKAMTLVITGDAEVIEEDDVAIRSASAEWKKPSVIRQLSKFRQNGGIAHFSRINIYLRDNWTCQYCGRKKQTKELTFDHVVPKYHGGKTNWQNIVAACKPCNNFKDNRTPQEAGMRLLKKPEEPKWLPAQIAIKMNSFPKKWEPYVDARSLSYWTQELEST